MKSYKFNQLLAIILCFGWFSVFSHYSHAGSTLSAGYHHVCGIKTDGNIACWGDNTHNQTQAPGGQFTQIGAGNWFNCGLRVDGSVVCWGQDTVGETSPPAGSFIQVDVGGSHACALYADGNPVCWGANGSGQASPPPGPFKQLALGNEHSCGLTPNGTISCWGSNSKEQSKEVSDMVYVTAGSNTTCGIKNDGTASCWGEFSGSYGYLSQIDFSLWGTGSYVSSDYQSFLFCGLRSDYSISCPSSTAAPTGRFTYVTVGASGERRCGSNSCTNYRHSFACGIRENGLVACWGENVNGRTTAPVNIEFKQPIQLPQPEAIAILREDLSMELRRLNYQPLGGPSQDLWANLRSLGQDEQGRFLWELVDYGVLR